MNLTKSIVLFTALTLFLGACGDAPAPITAPESRIPSNPLAGTWEGIPVERRTQDEENVEISSYIRFDGEKISYITVCKFPDNQKISSVISVCATQEKNQIRLANRGGHIENVGSKSCTSEINFDSLSIVGNKLKVNGATPIELKRTSTHGFGYFSYFPHCTRGPKVQIGD